MATMFTWRAASLTSEAGKIDGRAVNETTRRQDALTSAETELRREQYYFARSLGEGRSGTRLASVAIPAQADPVEIENLRRRVIEQGRLYSYVYDALLPRGYLAHAPDAPGGLEEVFKEDDRRTALIARAAGDQIVDPEATAGAADRRRQAGLGYARGSVALVLVVALLTLAECSRGRRRRWLAALGATCLVLTTVLTVA